MAPAVTELWRSVGSADIDTTLPDLWRDAASESAVSRALMSNLVIVRYKEQFPESGLAHLDPNSDVVRIAEQHPARTILLNYSPTTSGPCAPGKANIGVLTFGAGAARYGVEVVAVDAACAEASLPSIVRWLTRGDVPTTVWWTADLSRVALPASLVETGRQLLYDSSSWEDVREGSRTISAVLAHPHAPDLADLNWHRLAPLRWAIVHAIEREPGATSLQPSGVTIHYRKGELAAAWLIAAWFGRALRWTQPPAIVEAGKVEGKEGEGKETDERLTVALAGDGWELTASTDGQRVLVSLGADTPPFNVPVPHQTVADLVIAELRSLDRDVNLRDTMMAMASLIGST